ncbi:uncharacterized protein K02A2.6-like [Daphnia magna]|uniref:uncharacterized protein K02A2.6-like n=1 Tax=Daphnia magna TaxID=35525 RepID=UPI001E1BD25D|nr:uncharacterized protein K02A2.6-like [Daphnia magna]
MGVTRSGLNVDEEQMMPGETLDSWLIDLRSLVKTCGYGTGVDSVLRVQIVLGVADPLVREKLLFEKNLLLEASCEMMLLTPFRVGALIGGLRELSQLISRALPDHQPVTNQHSTPPTNTVDDQQHFRCNKCSRHHRKNQFRVSNVRCFTCGVIGHVSSCCPSSSNIRQVSSSQAPNSMAKVHVVEGEMQWVGDVESGGTVMTLPLSVEEDYYVSHALTTSSSGSEWCQQVPVDGDSVDVKLDSGATCNILPYETFALLPQTCRRLCPGPIVISYRAQDGLIRVLGLHTAKVVHRGAVFIIDFVVVDESGQPPLLGLPSCEKLNLIRRVDAVQSPVKTLWPPIVMEFMDVFMGLGKLPVENDIRLLSGANRVDPVVYAASRLPFRLEDRVFKKLDEMVKENILAPVQEPTEWVSRMMVVGKPDGDVRIGLDPFELNKAIQRQHFAVPTIEQLFSKLGKARYFCSLDAASGFYQIPLSNTASYLCTMAIPKGYYRFLRLPFGLKSASEIYLQTMNDLFGEMPVVLIYFDDFLVTGLPSQILMNRRSNFQSLEMTELCKKLGVKELKTTAYQPQSDGAV